ncbi:ribonuclease H1 [Orussus abietinus]|uniref:ribonuclease H1 n=1 Tax=Orussus abietinus TaxID=222816 RepID=UPI000626D8E2|nr:ribonuclease H1 [Orussus abietinus]
MSISFSYLLSALTVRSMSFYAVAKGRKPGIYQTWDECKLQVNQFSGPIYKKFKTQTEAEDFINKNSNGGENKIRKKYMSGKLKNALAYEKTVAAINPSAAPSRTISSIFGHENRNALSNTQGVKKRSLSTSTNSANVTKNPAKKIKLLPLPEDSPIKDASNFITDSDGYVNVFTDGACSSNGKKGAKAGVGVWFGDNHPLNISQPVDGRPTNNMAEIQAVTLAARQAHKEGIQKLKINTDSRFLISCITEWMPKWKKRGWMTVGNKPVINKCELLEMEEALSSLSIKWNHVRGHQGIHGNEMADKLARAGAELYKNENNDDQ